MSQERIVNLAFLSAALILWFLSGHLFAGAFDLFRPEWDLGVIGREFRLSNLMGISVGVVGGIALWRNEKLFLFAHEVAGELRKVTWPSMDETQLLTRLVIVTTVMVSVALWAFDTIIGAVTKLVYGL